DAAVHVIRSRKAAYDERRMGRLAELLSAIYMELVAQSIRKAVADDGHHKVQVTTVGCHPSIHVPDICLGVCDHGRRIEMIGRLQGACPGSSYGAHDDSDHHSLSQAPNRTTHDFFLRNAAPRPSAPVVAPTVCFRKAQGSSAGYQNL